MKRAANMNAPQLLSGIETLAPYYDGFILDLWGVVHDGVKPLPYTLEALRQLRAAKRIVWLLSNAPRRAQVVAAQLAAMGIGEDLYDGVLTSGEATRMALQDKYLEKWGRRVFHLGPERDKSIFEGLDAEILSAPDGADFVLNSGIFDMHNDKAEKYIPVLEDCRAKNLPMICANPDKVVYVGDHLVLCPGTLAEMYEKMDGEVVYFGKPHRTVYSHVLGNMGVQKVLAIGDSMATDVAGAVGAGIDVALVMSGIHRNELCLPDGGFAGEGALQAALKPYPVRPHYIMEHFSW